MESESHPLRLPPQIQPQEHNRLHQLLEVQREQGADRFDPVAFRFIEILINKRNRQTAAVALVLEERVMEAVADLRARFGSARATAEKTLQRIRAKHTGSVDQAEALFVASKFSSLQRLSARLDRTDCAASKAGTLTALTTALQQKEVGNGSEPVASTDSAAFSFEDLLRQQEQDALHPPQATALSAADIPFLSVVSHHNGLKAVQYFRETWAQQTAHKRVEEILGNPPEDAGPLNSHKLVVRSLMAMRDLSPEYLYRFLSYTETLLWLAQSVKQNEPAAEKANTTKTKSSQGKAKSSSRTSKFKAKPRNS